MFVLPREAIGVGYFKGRGIGGRSGKVTGRGRRARLPSRLRGPNLGPEDSSSATPNLAWNFGRSLLGFQGLMISLLRIC